MLPINEAATALGLTPRQTYRRVSSLRSILSPHIRRGDKGKLLLDSSALEILKRAEGLRSEGVTITDAMSTIRDEIGGNNGSEQERADGNLVQLVEVLQRENTRLMEEVLWLRSRVDELTPLALPRPRRWLRWLLPVRT